MSGEWKHIGGWNYVMGCMWGVVYDMWDPRSVGHASRRLLSLNIMHEKLWELKLSWKDNGKYFCASTIINKYGLLYSMNIIYMGLLIIIIMLWLMQKLIMQEFECEKINNADKYRFTSRWGFGIFRSLLGILNIITKSRLSSLNLVTVPKMPNLSLTPLKPSCHPQHDMRDAVLKYAIALLNK